MESLYGRVIGEYGPEHQMVVAIEELSELTKELTKYLRQEGCYEHLLEEMADVYICFQELKIIFGISNLKLVNEVDKKLERLERRLEERKK